MPTELKVFSPLRFKEDVEIEWVCCIRVLLRTLDLYVYLIENMFPPCKNVATKTVRDEK